MRPLTDEEAEAVGEDRRDGHDQPEDWAGEGAADYLDWYYTCLDGGR